MFQTIPFNIVGGTHENRTRSVSVQNTTNMYVQVNEYSDKKTSLQSWYGQKLVSEVAETNERGCHVMNEKVYRVVGNSLYEVDRSGSHTQKGAITGADRVIMDDDGDNLVIVSDKVYVYTSSSNSLQENTNSNLVNVKSVTLINSQFIYTTPDLSFISQPNLPFKVSGLDGIGAESSPDKLVRDYAFNQTIYRFGTRTTEPWYNSGVGQPPIDRLEGQQFSVGVGAINTLAHTNKALYWLGDDKAIYRVSGNTYERISGDALSNSIEGMTKIDDALGYTVTLQGQDFYIITFPSANVTYLLNEALGKQGWSHLSSGTQNNVYSATDSVEAYNKLYVVSGGKWLTLERDVYTQDTDTILRKRTTGEFTCKDFGMNNDSMVMSRLTLDVEQGVGLLSGQGELPRIMVEVSIDGGRSFPHASWMDLGRLGEHTLRTEVDLMARGQSFIFRLNMSDPVPLTIKGAYLKVKGTKR